MFEWKNQTAPPGYEPGTHRFWSAVLYQLSYGVVVNPDRTERPFHSNIKLTFPVKLHRQVGRSPQL